MIKNKNNEQIDFYLKERLIRTTLISSIFLLFFLTIVLIYYSTSIIFG